MSKVTTTERSAVEMALLSESADEALSTFKGAKMYYRKFYIDTTNFEAADEEYVIRSIRLYLLKFGLKSVDTLEEAEYIIYPRAAYSAIDESNVFLGIPSVPINLPGVGSATLPEIAIYSRRKQIGRNRLGLYGVNNAEDTLAFDMGMATGEKFYTRYVIMFFFGFAHTDMDRDFDSI